MIDFILVFVVLTIIWPILLLILPIREPVHSSYKTVQVKKVKYSK